MRRLCLLLAAPLALSLPWAAAQGRPLFYARGDLVPGSGRYGDPGRLLVRLFQGPTPAEARRGLTTAVPAGTRLVTYVRRGDRIVVDLSAAFLGARDPEAAHEQVVKTLGTLPFLRHFTLRVPAGGGRFRPFGDRPGGRGPPGRRPPAEGPAGGGALAGKRIAISPGHGYYWHSTLGWVTQRPLIDGLVEDLHTNEIVMEWVIPFLEGMGARCVNCRERTRNVREVILDNDQGGPAYRETGRWYTGASKGFGGGTYRYAVTRSKETARATWEKAVPAPGLYPVWVGYRAGTNRTRSAHFLVEHAAGTTDVVVDQTRDDLRLVYLGTFYFDGTRPARIHLTNRSADVGRAVIADRVRLGGGLGSIARGGTTSGRPRWQEAARYWAQYAGAPPSVYDPIRGGEDNLDDVTARPRYAEWRGADAYISVHTNAGGGTGTSSYIHNTNPSPGSARLQRLIHDQILRDIRSEYDPAWVDRGKRSANFGELRLLRTMPGVLLELAFHDDPRKKDHRYLHDPRFRRIVGRAIARGVLRYFAPTAPFPPEPPARFRVLQDGRGGLLVAFAPATGATGYRIEVSRDGYAFHSGGVATGTSWTTGPLPHGTALAFRVRALNAGGASLPTEVLVGRVSHTGRADVLLVQGFDRFDRYVKEPENRRRYLARYLAALQRLGDYSVGVDSAANEAVAAGLVPLGGYRAVVWSLGEESTRDETFSPLEQSRVRTYLQGGGRLFVTGAEAAWDLDRKGTNADRTFYRTQLSARYVADDAGTYRFGPAPGSVFAGLARGRFDDGTGPTYNVDFPDAIAPVGAGARPSLVYPGTTYLAGVEAVRGNGRVLNWGFPWETIRDLNLAAAYLDRALAFLLAPQPLEAPRRVAVGGAAALRLEVPGAAGRTYLLAASFGTHPGLPLGDGRTVPLNPDPLFWASVAGGPPFQGFQGRLDAAGRAQAGLRVPALPALRGLGLYVSGVVLGNGIATVLNWRRLTLR